MNKLINSTKFRLLLICAYCVCVTTLSVDAQTSRQDQLEPQWIKRLPIASNSTFSYEITKSRGRSISEAEKNCMNEIVAVAGLLDGVVVNYDNVTKTNTSQKLVNGQLSEIVKTNSESTSKTKSNDVKLFIKGIDQYCEILSDGTFMMTKLYAKSSTYDAPLFDNVEVTSMYGIHGLWRSAIVPGWGQLYKGSKAKGGVIFGGTVALAIGAVATENVRTSSLTKASQTYDVTSIKNYAAKADNMANMRNVCIGGAIALYAYNLIDAIVAPGARRVVVKNRAFNDFAFTPVVGQNYSGAAATYRF